jgi:hypothetical protein
MLNNQKVLDVIDTITSKVVLILGRFTAERKAVLDALREELRQRNYLPILLRPEWSTADRAVHPNRHRPRQPLVFGGSL